MESKQENALVRGRGSAHPYRLRLDIWSNSRRNVIWVMTRMVLGRLWLTSDLEALKGHSSLNRLWANVLSNHEMEGNRAQQTSFH